MIGLITTILEVSAIALIGWGLWWLFLSIVVRREGEWNAEDLEMLIVAKQLAGRDERMQILDKIGALPSCPDGSASDAQMELWQCYKALEAEDDRLCQQERLQIIESKGFFG